MSTEQKLRGALKRIIECERGLYALRIFWNWLNTRLPYLMGGMKDGIKVEEGCEMPEQKYKVAGNSYSETVLVFDGYSYDLATSDGG